MANLAILDVQYLKVKCLILVTTFFADLIHSAYLVLTKDNDEIGLFFFFFTNTSRFQIPTPGS